MSTVKLMIPSGKSCQRSLAAAVAFLFTSRTGDRDGEYVGGNDAISSVAVAADVEMSGSIIEKVVELVPSSLSRVGAVNETRQRTTDE